MSDWGTMLLWSALVGGATLAPVLVAGRRLTSARTAKIERRARGMGLPVVGIGITLAGAYLHPKWEEFSLLLFSLGFLTWVTWYHHRRTWHHWATLLIVADFLFAEWVLAAGPVG